MSEPGQGEEVSMTDSGTVEGMRAQAGRQVIVENVRGGSCDRRLATYSGNDHISKCIKDNGFSILPLKKEVKPCGSVTER